ncbi:MAG: hypothetical protein C4289_13880 [Chloroflexota bacterium]
MGEQAMPEYAVVGKPVPRVEAAEKVTGRALFAADIKLPGMLYAKLVRSPHGHARIRRIDVSRAKEWPGVVARTCRNRKKNRRLAAVLCWREVG